jgi:hypothetical protein
MARIDRSATGPKQNLRLKLALLASGRPAYAVAVQAGMGPGTLSRIVSGRRLATVAEARRVARTLRTKVSALFRAQHLRKGRGAAC